MFRFLIKCEDGVCTLDIRSAELSDSGEYKCVIQDFGKEGENETKCNVQIEEFAHKFTGELKGKKVVEDETAVFEIGVEEDDSEVKWFKDGVEIIPDGKRLLLCDPTPQNKIPCPEFNQTLSVLVLKVTKPNLYACFNRPASLGYTNINPDPVFRLHQPDFSPPPACKCYCLCFISSMARRFEKRSYFSGSKLSARARRGN